MSSNYASLSLPFFHSDTGRYSVAFDSGYLVTIYDGVCIDATTSASLDYVTYDYSSTYIVEIGNKIPDHKFFYRSVECGGENLIVINDDSTTTFTTYPLKPMYFFMGVIIFFLLLHPAYNLLMGFKK